MKRSRIVALTVALLMAAALCLTGCGKKESVTVTLNKNELTLFLYEEETLAASASDGGAIVWSSDRESVAKVENGLVIPQSAGTAVITAASGEAKDICRVTVRDDGSKPFITGADVTVMQGQTVDAGIHVQYNNHKLEKAVVTYTSADPAVASVSADGKVTGLQLGSTSVTAECTYRGLVLTAKTYRITVTEATYLQTERNVDLFLTDSQYVSNTAELKVTVYVDAQKVESPALAFTVKEGGEFVALSGATVTGVAVGRAVVTVEYAAANLFADIEVNVHSNYIEDNQDFYYAGIWDSTYAPYEGSDENFAGSYVYTTGAKNAAGPWDWHLDSRRTVSAGEIGYATQDIIDAGYKYFSYSIYYTGSTQVYLGLGDKAFWVSDGSNVKKDWFYLMENGKVTNKFRANAWITVVINFDRVLDPAKKCDLFVLSEGANEVSYVRQVRYWYDRENLLPADFVEPEKEVVTFTDMGDYLSSTNNDFMLSEATETYERFEGTIDGVSGAYLYRNDGGNWWTGRICLSNTHYDTYGEDGYYQLQSVTKNATWVTFDMFLVGESGIHVGLAGGVGPGVVAMNGSPKAYSGDGDCSYVRILNSEGYATDKLIANEWITVAVNFDAVGSAAINNEIYLGLDAGGRAAYAFINDIRYYWDDSFLKGEAAEKPDSTVSYHQYDNDELFIEPVADATLPVYESYSKVIAEMRGAYAYTTNSNEKFWNKLQFKQLHGSTYADDWSKVGDTIVQNGWTYVTFNLYLKEDRNLLLIYPDKNSAQGFEYVTLVCGVPYEGNCDVFLIGEDGRITDTLVSGEWMTVAIGISHCGPNGGAWTRAGISFEDRGTAYLTNIRYYTCDGFKVGTAVRNAVGQGDQELDPFTQFDNTELAYTESDSQATVEPAAETIGGVTGAYKYTSAEGKAWEGRVDFLHNTPYGWGFTGDDNWKQTNLKLAEMGWKHVVFNLYLTDDTDLMFFIPMASGNSDMVTAKVGQKITDSRIVVINSKGERTDTLVAGEWMTVAFRVDASAGDNWTWGWASISFTGAGSTAYFDNIRYYTDNSFLQGTLTE